MPDNFVLLAPGKVIREQGLGCKIGSETSKHVAIGGSHADYVGSVEDNIEVLPKEEQNENLSLAVGIRFGVGAGVGSALDGWRSSPFRPGGVLVREPRRHGRVLCFHPGG